MKNGISKPDGFLNENVLELGKHIPSVESVTLRLHSCSKDIKTIISVIEWEDGELSVCGSCQDPAKHALMVAKMQQDLMERI